MARLDRAERTERPQDARALDRDKTRTDERPDKDKDGEERPHRDKRDDGDDDIKNGRQQEKKKASDGQDKKGEKGDGEQGDDKPKKSRWPLLIIGLLFVLAIIGGAVYWYFTRNEESTDDAYTEGNAVSITPKVSGYVTERHVDDNTFVKAGDLLVRIDQRDYVNSLNQAKANLDLARAQLLDAQTQLDIARVKAPSDLQQASAQLDQAKANQLNAQREYDRQHSVDPRATTESNRDQSSTQLKSSSASVSSADAQVKVASLVPQNIQSAEATVKQRQAQVEQAEANLAQAELNLSYTDVRASQDGYVTRRNVDVGTFAQAGEQVFYIVAPDTWVVANFKETQLNRMRPGQRVDISVDAYPDLKLKGHIDTIQQGSGARFSAFPAENATGNFVKIVRRVPVKVIIDEGVDQKHGLPLGLSVEPTVQLQ